jgi:hypothetical protein
MGSGSTSSKISGFVGYQAQTSYQCQKFADYFLIPGSDTDLYVNDCKSPTQNKYDAEFRNALDAVNADTTLPVMLQYAARAFVETPDGRVRKLSPQELFSNHDALHYQDFGLALYWRYEDTLLNFPKVKMAKPSLRVTKEAQFVGWLPFVRDWMVQ